MCYGSICSIDLYDMWDLFESLTWYQWHHENVSESFVCPSPNLYDLYAQSPCVDQFRDSYHHHPCYAHAVCFNYQSSHDDVNF